MQTCSAYKLDVFLLARYRNLNFEAAVLFAIVKVSDQVVAMLFDAWLLSRCWTRLVVSCVLL